MLEFELEVGTITREEREKRVVVEEKCWIRQKRGASWAQTLDVTGLALNKE